MFVRVFFAGGADALSAAPSEAWLGPPGSPNASGDVPESCAGTLEESIIFRFLLVDVEVEGGARAIEGVELC